MKNIKPKLIELFKEGYCTPQIARIAEKINEPSTTIHYNIKKLEKEGAIKAYKAVFDHKKIGDGFSAYVLINLSADEYGAPERVANELTRYKEVESVNILAGDWELIIKVRVKNQKEFYNLLRHIVARKGIEKSKTLVSLKQIKTNFVFL